MLFREDPVHLPDERDAIHAGHMVIGQDEVERFLLLLCFLQLL